MNHQTLKEIAEAIRLEEQQKTLAVNNTSWEVEPPKGDGSNEPNSN